ncbi:MAG: efflux RND transporter periplasmic adaptor subunit [Capsulimonadales bacterium]|nr:efflux RND transporter periplasmic adaptor subunit [Capsulimonadales bacterium]
MKKNANECSFLLVAGMALLFPPLAGCPNPAPAVTPTPEVPSPISSPNPTPSTTPGIMNPRKPSSRPSEIVLTGALKADREVRLTTRNAGRIAEVFVREGDAIKARQILARLDTRELTAQERSADAAIAAARAQAAQAAAALRQQIVSTTSAIAEAEAGLRGAKAQLDQLLAGARSQEKAQAGAQVAIARANLMRAEDDWKRYERLARAGAVAEMEADQYRTNRDIAAEQVRAQEEALSLLNAGARQQEIEQARQAVRRAEEMLRQAKATEAQIDLRRAEVQAAQAVLWQRRNEKLIATETLRDADLVAPFAGWVTARSAQPGQRVAADETLFTLVSRAVYFEPSVPETDFRHLRVGERVQVTVDAFPGRSFTGRITLMGASAQTTGRAFPVRIELLNDDGRSLRPGMFARTVLVRGTKGDN